MAIFVTPFDNFRSKPLNLLKAPLKRILIAFALTSLHVYAMDFTPLLIPVEDTWQEREIWQPVLKSKLLDEYLEQVNKNSPPLLCHPFYSWFIPRCMKKNRDDDNEDNKRHHRRRNNPNPVTDYPLEEIREEEENSNDNSHTTDSGISSPATSRLTGSDSSVHQSIELDSGVNSPAHMDIQIVSPPPCEHHETVVALVASAIAQHQFHTLFHALNSLTGPLGYWGTRAEMTNIIRLVQNLGLTINQTLLPVSHFQSSTNFVVAHLQALSTLNTPEILAFHIVTHLYEHVLLSSPQSCLHFQQLLQTTSNLDSAHQHHPIVAEEFDFSSTLNMITSEWANDSLIIQSLETLIRNRRTKELQQLFRDLFTRCGRTIGENGIIQLFNALGVIINPTLLPSPQILAMTLFILMKRWGLFFSTEACRLEAETRHSFTRHHDSDPDPDGAAAY